MGQMKHGHQGLLPCDGAHLLLDMASKESVFALIPGRTPGQPGSRASEAMPSELCLCPSVLLSSLPSEVLGPGQLLPQVCPLYLVAPAALGSVLFTVLGGESQPGKFHGQGSLEGYSPWGCKESDINEPLSLTN